MGHHGMNQRYAALFQPVGLVFGGHFKAAIEDVQKLEVLVHMIVHDPACIPFIEQIAFTQSAQIAHGIAILYEKAHFFISRIKILPFCARNSIAFFR